MGENGLLEKVKQAIDSNTTVKGLMNDFRDIGIKAKDELETIVMAEDYWIKINDIEREPIENYKVSELKELPATIVKNKGIEYRIHGITHDPPGRKVLSKETRNFYRESALKLNNLREREECLYEPGMPDVLGIKNADEIFIFDIAPYFVKTCFNFFTDIKRLRNVKKDLEDKLECILVENNKKIADLTYRTRKDPIYLPLLREAYKRQLFPMPLEIEKRALKFDIYGAMSGRFLNKFLKYFCRPELSKEYARCIKEFAAINKPRVLHFVVGLVHESEVAYYLQNSKS